MKRIEVNHSEKLVGSVDLPGAKNSSLALIAACCLAGDTVTLQNIPDISDIYATCKILTGLGADVVFRDGNLTIDPRGICSAEISPEDSSVFRTAYYFAGALLAAHKRVSVGYPGGDNFKSRPIDQHFKGFRALGASVELLDDHYVVQASALKGAEIFFDVITSGATINIMLAAVLANGRTVLRNAARDPEVVDTAIFLNKIGAKISGAGTDTIIITGVEQLGGCKHTVIQDRLIAGTYLIAAGATGGRITVRNAMPEHLTSLITKLREIGMEFDITENTITAWADGELKATRIRTGKYPVFESDFQQPVTVLLLKAPGNSLVADKIYPFRFNHCEQLKRMGADIRVLNGLARIRGGKELHGAKVHAGDIRAGACLVLAGLMAQGTTVITGVEHIERGFRDIIDDFKSMGADIRMCRDDGDALESVSNAE